jgi:hypothetical protein
MWGLIAVLAATAPLPVYPGAVHARIGDEIVLGGEAHRVAYFRTRDDVLTVAEFFSRRWREAGLPVVVHGRPPGEMVVSAVDTRAGLLQAVVLSSEEGVTLGLSVSRNLRQTTAAPEAEEDVRFAESMRVAGERAPQRTRIVSQPFQAAREHVIQAAARRGLTLSREWPVADLPRRVVLELRGDSGSMAVVLSEMGPQETLILELGFLEGAR